MTIEITEKSIVSVKLEKKNGQITWDEMAFFLMRKLETRGEIKVIWWFPVF